METERQARLSYQSATNRTLEERFEKEDQRYEKFREDQRRSLVTAKKQFGTLQDELTRLQTRTGSLETKQNTMLGKINTTREIQDLTTQKIDGLARSQASLYDDLTRTMAEVDSLYYKAFKKYKPKSP